MIAVLVAAVFAGPWIESSDFPKAKQEAALAATLRLKNPKNNQEGTAVRIGQAGFFVFYMTACHAVADTTAVNLESYNAATYPKPLHAIPNVEVKERWPDIDVALLRAMEPKPPGFLKICPAHAIPEKVPFRVLTVGCSGGLAPVLMADRVRTKKLVRKPDKTGGLMWETEKAPVEGRSGGPIIDTNGYLIGICSGNNGGFGYYTHVSDIRRAVKKAGGWAFLLEDSEPMPGEKEKSAPNGKKG